MAKILTLSPRESDAAAMGGSAFVEAAPVTNLQDMQPTNSARSAADADNNTYVTLDALSPKAWDTLYIGRNDIPATDVPIRLRADNDPDEVTGPSPGLDTGPISPWPTSGRPTDPGLVWFDVLKQFTPSEAYRYWRLDIDADNVEIGRLILGTSFVPHYNFARDWTNAFAATDGRIKTPYGHTLTSARKRPRVWSLPFDAVTRDDAEDALYELLRQRGTAGDIVVCLDPAATTRLHRKTMLATFDEPPVIGQPYFNTFRTTLTFYELL